MMTPVNPEVLMNNEIETPRIDRSSSTSSMDSWVTDVRLSPTERVVCGGVLPSSTTPRPKFNSNSRGSTSSTQFSFPPPIQKNEVDSPIRPSFHPDPSGGGRPPLAVRTFRPSNQPSGTTRSASDNSYRVGNHDKNPAVTLQLGMRSEGSSSHRLLLATGKPSVQMQPPLQGQSFYPSTKEVTRNSSSLPPPRSKSGQVINGSDPTQVDQAERVKTKLMSVWNNVKYGWTMRTKTKFSHFQPIWLLGQSYYREKQEKQSHGESSLEHGPSACTSMERFKLDFKSRIWLTYRREFPALTGSTLTSDCGWGCMLRSGQMMLAQALLCHFLGRSWRTLGVVQTTTTETLHRMIIRWFGDDPSSICPFSLHRLVAIGEDFGKKAGDWYGPASVAFILKQALGKASEENPMLDKVCIYIAQDCTVYKADVIELCTAPPRVRKIPDQGRRPSPKTEATSPLLSRTWSNPQLASKLEGATEPRWRGAVVLVPVRLGGDKLNPIYIPCIKALLSNDSCIGIIGGKPKHSLYFVGFQEEDLIHLDPHCCRETVDVLPADFSVDSFHCTIPRKIAFTKMDPSCSIGFYFRTRGDFERFTDFIQPALIPPYQKSDYPIFVISDGSSLEASSTSLPTEDYVAADGGSSDYESEDFVLL